MKLSIYNLKNTVLGTVVIHAIATTPRIGLIFIQKTRNILKSYLGTSRSRSNQTKIVTPTSMRMLACFLYISEISN